MILTPKLDDIKGEGEVKVIDTYYNLANGRKIKICKFCKKNEITCNSLPSKHNIIRFLM